MTRDRTPFTTIVVALCALTLLAPLAWPLATGRIFALTDLGFFHLPMRAIYRDALRAGDWPLWTPALFAGYYVHGEGQTGMLHPLHLLLYRTLPLGVAFNLEFLASYPAAFAGMWWFLRRLDLSHAASAFGAMLFAFGGFQVLHFLHLNMVAVTAHIPWLLAALDVMIVSDHRASRAAGFAAVAAIVASMLLLGFQQAVWWNAIAASWFVLFRMAESRRVGRLVPCIGAAVCGVLLGAVQVVPTLDLLRESVRSLTTRAFALTYALHPYNVLQFWSPYVFVDRVYSPIDYPWTHEFGIYPGTAAVIAPIWLWTRGAAHARRRLALWAAGLAAALFVLALGRHGVVDVALTYVPVVGSFRAPARYILLVQFALAILAAIAFDDLASRDAGQLTRGTAACLCVPLILSALTAALISTGVLPIRRLPLAPIALALAGTAMVGLVTIAILLAASGRRWAVPILAVLTAADLGAWGLSYVYRTPPATVAHQSIGVPPAADPIGRATSPPNWGNRVLLEGYRLADGYAGLYPLTTLPYEDVPFQRLAGLRVRFTPMSTMVAAPGAVPRARLLTDVRRTADAAADIARIDLDRTALVTEALPPLGGEPGRAQIVVDRPGFIVIDVDAPAPQLLSIGERYHRGWTAASGGRPLQVVRVNGDFLACLVGAGAHRVELRFAPRSFTAGAWLSAFGALGTALGVLLIGRTRHA